MQDLGVRTINPSQDDAALERKRAPFWSAVHYVYALVDPRDERVRYIGISANPVDRFDAHRTKSHSSVVQAWVDELASLSLRPRMIVLDSAVGFHDASRIENRLIYEYRRFHGGLLNRTDPLWIGEVTDMEQRVRRWIVRMLRDARKECNYWQGVARRRKPRRDTRVLPQDVPA